MASHREESHPTPHHQYDNCYPEQYHKESYPNMRHCLRCDSIYMDTSTLSGYTHCYRIYGWSLYHTRIITMRDGVDPRSILTDSGEVVGIHRHIDTINPCDTLRTDSFYHPWHHHQCLLHVRWICSYIRREKIPRSPLL